MSTARRRDTPRFSCPVFCRALPVNATGLTVVDLRWQMQRLGLALGIELRWYRADDAGLKVQLPENGAHFLDGQGGLIEVEIDDIVIAIDLVAQAGNRFEFVIQLEDFFQVSAF